MQGTTHNTQIPSQCPDTPGDATRQRYGPFLRVFWYFSLFGLEKLKKTPKRRLSLPGRVWRQLAKAGSERKGQCPLPDSSVGEVFSLRCDFPRLHSRFSPVIYSPSALCLRGRALTALLIIFFLPECSSLNNPNSREISRQKKSLVVCAEYGGGGKQFFSWHDFRKTTPLVSLNRPFPPRAHTSENDLRTRGPRRRRRA